MGRYLAWRALRMLLTILVVAAVTFVALRAAGDPASLLLPPDATPAQREELRRAFGLDQPLALQYARFVARAAQGDFGESLRYRTPAMPLVLERLPATLELTLAGLGLTLVVSIGLGILAALREGRPVDLVIVSGSLLGQSIPTFWLGLTTSPMAVARWPPDRLWDPMARFTRSSMCSTFTPSRRRARWPGTTCSQICSTFSSMGQKWLSGRHRRGERPIGPI